MCGIGTLADTGSIVVGGLVGLLVGKRLRKRFQETVVAALAMSVMFVGVANLLPSLIIAILWAFATST